MTHEKYCDTRPNICSPSDICDLRHLDKGYVYGVETVINPYAMPEYEDNDNFELVHANDIQKHKWNRMLDEGLVSINAAFGALIVVRPRCASDRTNICRAMVRENFAGEVNSCCFYVGGSCTCEEPPKYCTQDFDKYGDNVFMWGYMHRKIADDWMPKQKVMRAVVVDVLKCMTAEQRAFIVQDENTPIADLICCGIVDRELFNEAKVDELL